MDRPTTAELAAAVREFLETELLPVLEDERLRFRTRVAMNALAICQRELEAGAGDEPTQDELAEVARRIRAGDVPDDLLPWLKEHVAAKLRVASPRTLELYE
jgi:hypothetical protein